MVNTCVKELIASQASLRELRAYKEHKNKNIKRYIKCKKVKYNNKCQLKESSTVIIEYLGQLSASN
jgi:hypothetical protein